MVKHLLRDPAGATSIEYGLILAMVFLAIIASVRGVADETNGLWATVDKEVTEVMSGT